MTTAEKLTTIAENQQRVYDAGAAVAQKKPYVDTSKGVQHHEYLCMANRWIDQLDRFDFSNITNGAYLFQNCSQLITAPALGTSKATRLLYIFYNCYNLETVEGVDFSSCTNASNAVTNCTKLKKIVLHGTIPCSIDFGPCKVLSGETIRDIMNALSADGTGKTITIRGEALTAANADGSLPTAEWEALKTTAQGKNWSVAVQ